MAVEPVQNFQAAVGFDAGFSIPFAGSAVDDDLTSSMIPKPGNVIKIVAFSNATGFYGETDIRIPGLADGDDGTTNLDILIDIDLLPPKITVELKEIERILRLQENSLNTIAVSSPADE